MSKRFKLILRNAPDDPTLGPILFPFHHHMSSRSYHNWVDIGRMITGDPEWRPADVLYIESHKEIVDIMGKPPKGEQACL